MTESEFLDLAEATLDAIEASLDRLCEQDMVDVECSRSGNVLEIEFVGNGSKVIINSQAPMQELWVAARAGGFHFRRDGERWVDTRKGGELYAALSVYLSEQAGAALKLG